MFPSPLAQWTHTPWAPPATSLTEDLVYFLDASGWDHGVSLEGVLVAARFIADALGRPLATKVGEAGGWIRERAPRSGAIDLPAAHDYARLHKACREREPNGRRAWKAFQRGAR